jgi:hypothetical protein
MLKNKLLQKLKQLMGIKLSLRTFERLEDCHFSQSARCPVVKQPNLAAVHSEVVGGRHCKAKQNL